MGGEEQGAATRNALGGGFGQLPAIPAVQMPSLEQPLVISPTQQSLCHQDHRVHVMSHQQPNKPSAKETVLHVHLSPSALAFLGRSNVLFLFFLHLPTLLLLFGDSLGMGLPAESQTLTLWVLPCGCDHGRKVTGPPPFLWGSGPHRVHGCGKS